MHFGKKIVSLLVSQVWLGHANVAGGDVGCGLREGLPRLAGLTDSMQDDGQFASYGYVARFFPRLPPEAASFMPQRRSSESGPKRPST